MDEFKRKKEKQTGNKDKTIVFKVNTETYNAITNKYKESKTSTMTEFITRCCIDCQNYVVPYAEEIVQELHKTHTAIQDLSCLTNTQELSNAVSQLCLTLLNKKDYIQHRYY